MGSRLTKELLQGILVPDERVTLENIHSGSSYTEQGPCPRCAGSNESGEHIAAYRYVVTGCRR